MEQVFFFHKREIFHNIAISDMMNLRKAFTRMMVEEDMKQENKMAAIRASRYRYIYTISYRGFIEKYSLFLNKSGALAAFFLVAKKAVQLTRAVGSSGHKLATFLMRKVGERAISFHLAY